MASAESERIVKKTDVGDRNLWEMQRWETAVAYDRFSRYFLVQDSPRSVVEAYRQYQRDKGATEEQVGRIKSTPGFWARWAYARTSQDEPINGALTWAERARAFDTAQQRSFIEEHNTKWRERRLKLSEKEWEAGEELMARGRRMLQGLLFQKRVVETVDKETGVPTTETIYEPTDWGERELIGMFKMGSELMRRGAGLTPNNRMPSNDSALMIQAKEAGIDIDKVVQTVLETVLSKLEHQS